MLKVRICSQSFSATLISLPEKPHHTCWFLLNLRLQLVGHDFFDNGVQKLPKILFRMVQQFVIGGVVEEGGTHSLGPRHFILERASRAKIVRQQDFLEGRLRVSVLFTQREKSESGFEGNARDGVEEEDDNLSAAVHVSHQEMIFFKAVGVPNPDSIVLIAILMKQIDVAASYRWLCIVLFNSAKVLREKGLSAHARSYEEHFDSPRHSHTSNALLASQWRAAASCERYREITSEPFRQLTLPTNLVATVTTDDLNTLLGHHPEAIC